MIGFLLDGIFTKMYICVARTEWKFLALFFRGCVMVSLLHQLASLGGLTDSPDLKTHVNIFYFLRPQY